MEDQKTIQTLIVNKKESINLYPTFFEVVSLKKVFKKKRQFNYNEIESVSLRMNDPKQYVESLGIFAILNIKIKKKVNLGFEINEPDVRNLQHHSSVIVAFVGSMKACIENMIGNTEFSFSEPLIEIIEPEILLAEPPVTRRLLGNQNEEISSDSTQKLLK